MSDFIKPGTCVQIHPLSLRLALLSVAGWSLSQKASGWEAEQVASLSQGSVLHRDRQPTTPINGQFRVTSHPNLMSSDWRRKLRTQRNPTLFHPAQCKWWIICSFFHWQCHFLLLSLFLYYYSWSNGQNPTFPGTHWAVFNSDHLENLGKSFRLWMSVVNRQRVMLHSYY